jgi:hypothetical protein
LLISVIDDDESMRLALAHTTLHFASGAARIHMPQTRLSSTVRPAPTARGKGAMLTTAFELRRQAPTETIN